MSEQKKPQAGEWWEYNGVRIRIVGTLLNGRVVCEYRDGKTATLTQGDWWHHEPRCTSWDWQPEPEPEWFDLTPFDGHVLRTPIDHVSKGGRFSEVDGLSGATVGFAKRNGYTQFRCLLKDAPPELLEKTKKPTCINTFDCNAGDHADACPASKPVESPDDWVTITDPNHIARRDIDHIRVLNQKTEPVIGLAGLPKRQIISELLCRRRDLPPIPEPKPATQTIVFHEVLNLIGIPDRYVMEWWSEIPFGAIPTGKTVTREVVR